MSARQRVLDGGGSLDVDTVDLRMLSRLQHDCEMLKEEQTRIWATVNNLPGRPEVKALQQDLGLAKLQVQGLASRAARLEERLKLADQQLGCPPPPCITVAQARLPSSCNICTPTVKLEEEMEGCLKASPAMRELKRLVRQ